MFTTEKEKSSLVHRVRCHRGQRLSNISAKCKLFERSVTAFLKETENFWEVGCSTPHWSLGRLCHSPAILQHLEAVVDHQEGRISSFSKICRLETRLTSILVGVKILCQKLESKSAYSVSVTEIYLIRKNTDLETKPRQTLPKRL